MEIMKKQTGILMKRVMSVLMALLMVLTSLPMSAVRVNADNTSSDGMYGYELDEAGNAIITYYSGDSYATVDIPSQIDGHTVTEIGDSAFGNSSVTEVTIPGSVTKIGRWTFSGCGSLTAINVSEENTLYQSENGVLFNKEKTELIQYPAGKRDTSYVIPGSVTYIGYGAFYGCSGLTEVTIPGSVTEIGHEAFRGCSGLTEVTISESVTEIGHEAFAGCSGLTEVTIPGSVTYIGYNAFAWCSGLTEVTIPGSVTEIGHEAFRYCSGLTAINVSEKNTSYQSENGVLFNKGKTKLIQYPAGKSDISYAIPGSVVEIGDSAFYSCSGLKEVTIFEGVTEIGYGAFSDCSSLTEVTIPGSVTYIEDYAFSDCSGLKDIYYMGDAGQYELISGIENIPSDAVVHYMSLEYADGGVVVEAETGALPEDVKLNVTMVQTPVESEQYNTENAVAYDIYFEKDGQKYSLTAESRFQFPYRIRLTVSGAMCFTLVRMVQSPT